MFTKQQETLLNKFADLSDKLFDLGIISTDSFTGEIGEYVVCKYFKLKKSNRVARAVDGVCELGNNYQVKAKVVSNNNFNYNITKLDTTAFHFLIVVYLDRQYNPIKILRIPSKKIKAGQISITSSLMNSGIEIIDKSEIKIPATERKAINEFAEAYDALEENKIIRSRRIVGDIGEFYACRRLGLEISEMRNEKGIDARDKNGFTYEIKTRRVYESGRRVSETRRLNNLVGKSADYLIVVALDRKFKCAGMWLIPMQNLKNPKSANLKVVNTTVGTKNLMPSKISWLETGDSFNAFDLKEKAKSRPVAQKTVKQPKPTLKKKATPIKEKVIIHQEETQNFVHDNSNPFRLGCFGWTSIIFVILYLLSRLTN